MSNLTCASTEISASTSGTRNENTGSDLYPQPFLPTSTCQEPQPRKKRSLPGNPDPDAEVIALSPRTLLATNRFICDICNKGFRREQNLQLHRRGHNLPWKLKQRTNEDIVRKKVYVCPEATCVHHDPARALGDLTGIKKHFCRKHGEKKWKCDKCSRRYAVQSDLKAHSKICGTKEYRCDCGTLFSRRDSFITHRSFCDALAQESARATISSDKLSSSEIQLPSHGPQTLPVKKEQEFNLRPKFLPLLASQPKVAELAGSPLRHLDVSSSPLLQTHLDQSFYENPNPSYLQSSFFQLPAALPHASATALLQKASQMGLTVSNTSPSYPKAHHRLEADVSECTIAAGYDSSPSMASSSSAAVPGFGMTWRDSYGNKAAGIISDHEEQVADKTMSSLFHDMMSSLPLANGSKMLRKDSC